MFHPVTVFGISTRYDFFPLPENMGGVVSGAEKTLFVLSSTDPYCTLEDAIKYMELEIPFIIFPKMGHINVESGYGPWEWILEICLNEKVALI